LNLSALRQYVRDLTGVYATDLVSDSLLDRWVNESLYEIYRLQKWPWAVATLVTGTDTPTFDSQFHAVLAYGTAIRVLNTQSDDTKRGEAYAAEATNLMNAMMVFYFPQVAAGAVGNRGQIRQQARDLSDVNAHVVSDAMINQWIAEAYNDIARQRSWDWLEATQQFTDASTVGPYTLTNGTRRVMSVQLVDSRGVVEEVFERADTINVNSNRRIAYYDVTSTGVLTLAPAERFDGTETYTLRVRYTQAVVNLADDAATPAFHSQFYPLLAYMAAARIIQYVGGDEAKLALCNDSIVSLFDGMITFYELSNDDTSFQMGVEGRELQQYPYWFRRV
jgi:hypothetical protein